MKILAALVLLLIGVMSWQHVRYLNARRQLVQDRQPLLYASDSLHVITFLEVSRDEELIPSVSALRRAIEAAGGLLVYAGQAAFTRPSEQIGPADWDAVVFAQYPSREAYEAAASGEGLQKALGAFTRSYSHGMKRPAALNLLVPQGLLAARLVDLLQGNWSAEELKPQPMADHGENAAQLDEVVARLRQLQPVNDDAVLVFNLIQSGTPAQESANRSYGFKMIKRMASLAHGPMHVGKAVTLEGDATFDQAIVVYYPGPGYFASLLESDFFRSIIGDKQLNDTQAVPTVPILSRLES